MTRTDLIKRAIESARCRLYKVRARESYSVEHQHKAENQTEIMDITIEALEKQIPKKPLFGTVLKDTAYHCGSCKNFIGYYDRRIYEYCHNCGQKLDWSE